MRIFRIYIRCWVYIFWDLSISIMKMGQFSVPQLEYPLGWSWKKGSHVYILLQVFWVIWLILLFDINVVLMPSMLTWCHNSTIWRHNSSTMATINRKYTRLPYCYCPLVGILFEVVRIGELKNVVIFEHNVYCPYRCVYRVASGHSFQQYWLQLATHISQLAKYICHIPYSISQLLQYMWPSFSDT